MAWRFLALCAVGLLAVPANGQAATSVACKPPVVTDATFAMSCAYAHQSGRLTLVMRGAVEDATTAKPTAIDILAAGKQRQTLTVESEGVPLDALQKEAFGTIDINFDHYDDLKVLTATSAGPNSAYAYWLYRPTTNAFERRQDLDDLLSGFDIATSPKTKTVSMSGRESCCAWAVDIYRWANDRLQQISHEESGEFDLGELLSDIPSIQTFRETEPLFCATRTTLYDDSGRITRDVIQTEGDPCDEAQDYRKNTKGVDKALNGTKRHGNMIDIYKAGILLRRTITYDPPKQP